MTNARVWRRAAKSMLVRVSTVVQVVPSLEPSRTQLLGSRPGTSSAEVSVYCLTVAEAVSWQVMVAVFANASHFVMDVSSTSWARPSAVPFSAVTVTVLPVALSFGGAGGAGPGGEGAGGAGPPGAPGGGVGGPPQVRGAPGGGGGGGHGVFLGGAAVS